MDIVQQARQGISRVVWRDIGLDARDTHRPVLIPQGKLYYTKLFTDPVSDDIRHDWDSLEEVAAS